MMGHSRSVKKRKNCVIYRRLSVQSKVTKVVDSKFGIEVSELFKLPKETVVFDLLLKENSIIVNVSVHDVVCR